jgi:hypothetical protein
MRFSILKEHCYFFTTICFQIFNEVGENTALHRACVHKQPEIVKGLLSAEGTEVNKKNNVTRESLAVNKCL